MLTRTLMHHRSLEDSPSRTSLRISQKKQPGDVERSPESPIASHHASCAAAKPGRWSRSRTAASHYGLVPPYLLSRASCPQCMLASGFSPYPPIDGLSCSLPCLSSASRGFPMATIRARISHFQEELGRRTRWSTPGTKRAIILALWQPHRPPLRLMDQGMGLESPATRLCPHKSPAPLLSAILAPISSLDVSHTSPGR